MTWWIVKYCFRVKNPCFKLTSVRSAPPLNATSHDAGNFLKPNSWIIYLGTNSLKLNCSVITVTICGNELWTFFNSIALEQGSQNKIQRKVSFQRENALWAAIYKKRPQNELNFIKIYNFAALEVWKTEDKITKNLRFLLILCWRKPYKKFCL